MELFEQQSIAARLASARNAERQLEDQIAILDRLIVEGNAEIIRLQALLAENSTPSARQPDVLVAFPTPRRSSHRKAA